MIEHFPPEYLNAPDEPVNIIQSIAIPQPPAGSTWTYTVPPLARIKPLALVFTLLTDATVADRYVHLHIESNQGRIFDMGDTVPVPASTIRTFIFFRGANYGAATAIIFQTVHELPDELYMLPGNFLEVVVPGLVAGDQFFNITLHCLSQEFKK